ncbi:MAG: GlsB/YeaQ/YmgE family stress response membrane protein [Caldilineaceae bacterium]
MINFIIWIIVGGLLGWIASMVMRTDAQQGTLLNIVVGIVGAFVAGLVLTPLFGIGTINQNNFSMASLLVSLLGAIILLGIVNLFRRGTVR